MLALKEIGPPARSKSEDNGEQLLGVRIMIFPDAINCDLFPDKNRIGTAMLGRLLRSRIELAGPRVSQMGSVLEFNRSYYVLAVSAIETALRATKEELQELGLLNYAQIAWLDSREGFFRLWHPKTGRFDKPSDQTLDSDRAMLDALTAALWAGRQSEYEPPGE
jgi:hypothetical protein